LVYSDDAGTTFRRIPNTGDNWRPLGFDDGALFMTGTDSLQVTRDGGASWRGVQDSVWVHVVFGGGSQSFPVKLTGFVGAVAHGDTVYAAATAYVFGGVYRHAPTDTAWVPVVRPGTDQISSGVQPRSLVRHGGALWFSHSVGVHRSLDGGETWTDVTAGLPSSAGGFFLQEGLFGLVAVTNGQNAYFRWNGSGWSTIPAPPATGLESTTGDRFYIAAIDRAYAYDGTAWSALPTVVASSPLPVAADAAAGGGGFVLATSLGQLLRSTDGGTVWTTALANATGPFALKPGEMLANTTTGFQRSTNGGFAWTPTNRPTIPSSAPSQRPNVLLAHDGAYYALYGYTRSGKHGVLLEQYSGAFRSTDAGATWTPIFDGLPFGTVGRSPIGGGASFTGAVFAVTGAGCIVLPNGSSTWSARPCPATGSFYEAAEAEGRWVVRGYSGLAASTDGGLSWTPATAGLPVPTDPQDAAMFWSGARLARTSAGLLLAADAGAGFHFYLYSGGTWVFMPAPFPAGVSWGGFIETDAHVLFGGSNGRGMWRTTLGVVTAAGESPAPALALGAPAPNPARGAVRVGFALGAPGNATLAVYDALGRRVAVLVDGALAAGAHEATWPAEGAAAGVYVVRLTTPEGTLVQRVTVSR
ncbi:MAG TPA: T9SS type A sorting domain-containing protein, partial [Rhodothermales bacterium]|nr:T9SS type A sorting domain-containing protein [Rhodothermales bacterium]